MAKKNDNVSVLEKEKEAIGEEIELTAPEAPHVDEVGVESKARHFNTGRENKRAGRNPLPAERDTFAFELEKGHEGLSRVVMYRLNWESRRFRRIYEGEYREKIGAIAELYNYYACNLVEGMGERHNGVD